MDNSGDKLINTSTLPAKQIEKPASFQRFEDAMRRIVKVSKDEIKKREVAVKSSAKNGRKS